MTDNAGFDDTMGLYRVVVIAGLGMMGLGFYDIIQTPTTLSLPGFASYIVGYYLAGVVLAQVRYNDKFTRIDPPPLVLTASLWPLWILLDGIEDERGQSP